MSNKLLSDLFHSNTYTSDKDRLGYIDNFYNNFLKKYKETPITMMEIGVETGGSLKLWKDYFHEKSEIYGADIDFGYYNHVFGVFTVIGDMYSLEKSSLFPDKFFDLIIDDGPHTLESFVLLMMRYFSKLKDGGSLIIEDIIVSSWVEPLVELSARLGYSSCEVIDMTGKQKTQELLNLWQNGLYILNLTK